MVLVVEVANISLLLLFPADGLAVVRGPCPLDFTDPCCCCCCGCFFVEDGADVSASGCGFVGLLNFTTTAVMLSVLPSCKAACTKACAYSSADKS